MTEVYFNRGAIDAPKAISEGWNLIKDDYLMYLGIALVTYLLISCVPCLNILLYGPIWCGVYYAVLKRMNNEAVSFGDMFKGFDKFVPAMLVGLLQNIPAILAQILQLFGNVGTSVIDGMNRGNRFQASSPEALLAGGLGIVILIVIFVMVALSFIIGVSVYFAYPLIMEYNLDAKSAIQLSAKAAWSNLGGIIVLAILNGLLALVGVLALCIGAFLVLPVMFASYAVAYRQVFPPPSNFTPNTAPPPPTEFGDQYGKPVGF